MSDVSTGTNKVRPLVSSEHIFMSKMLGLCRKKKHHGWLFVADQNYIESWTLA